jgi:hypothetical protein
VTSHKMILDTLMNHFHVNNSVVLWLHDYFVDRFQGVVTNLNSSSRLLLCTILGLFLFAVLLDPCQIADRNCKLIAYAEDCTLLHRVFPRCQDTLQSVIDEFIGSTTSQELEINPTKCQLLEIYSSRAKQISPL